MNKDTEKNELFEKWFKAQFKKLPSDLRNPPEILAELIAAKKNVNKLERELKEQREIYQAYEAALYSKNASEKNFKI